MKDGKRINDNGQLTMDNEKKYKKTEIGEIPKEWEVTSLRNIFKVSSGSFLPQKSMVGGRYPVYGGNGISGYHNEYLFDESKIVIGRVGAKCGCVYISQPKSWITDNALYVSEKLIEFDDKFIYYLLNYIDLNKFANQNAQPVISGKKIYEIKIFLPPLQEQQKIASILSTLDEHIEQTDALIEKTKELKKGLMQKLLTKGIGHIEFKKTEIGEIPKEWEVKKFSEVFHTVTDYVANGSFASLRENVEYKDEEDFAILIRLVDYKNNYKGPFVYVDKKAYEFLEKSKLRPNDIIIANVGAYAGFVFRAPNINKPMTLGPNSILVKSNECEDYLYYWLKSDIGKKQLNNIISTTAQPKFNKTDFKNLICAIPPLQEQQKIASVLSEVDNQIEEYELKKEKLQNLKKGLMQKLLTGKIRVKI